MGSVPRVGEGSTAVRACFKSRWRNCGTRCGLVGRNGADVVKRWGVCGIEWGRAGNGWRGKVTVFLGVRGANGLGGGGRGGAVGRHWLSDMANARRE